MSLPRLYSRAQRQSAVICTFAFQANAHTSRALNDKRSSQPRQPVSRTQSRNLPQRTDTRITNPSQKSEEQMSHMNRDMESAQLGRASRRDLLQMVTRLQTQLRQSQQDQACQGSQNATNKTIARLVREKAALQKTCDKTQKALQSMQKKRDILQIRNKSLADSKHKIHCELKTVRSELRNQESLTKKAEQKVSTLQMECNDLQETLCSRSTESTGSQQGTSELFLKQCLERQRQKNMSLCHTNAELTEKLTAQQEENTLLEEELFYWQDAAQYADEEPTSEADPDDARLEELQRQVTELQTSLSQAQSRVQDLERNQETDDSQGRDQRLEEERDCLRGEKDDLELELRITLSALTKQKTISREAQNKLQSFEVERAELQKVCDSLQKERDHFESELKTVKSALSQHESVFRKAQNDLKSFEVERAESQKAQDSLQRDNGVLQSELEKVKAALSEQQNITTAAQETIESLEKERDTLKNVQDSLHKEKETLQKTQKSLEEERDTLHSELKTVRSALSEETRVTSEAQQTIARLQSDTHCLQDTARALDQSLKAANTMFSDTVRKCHAAVMSAREQTGQMEQRAQQLSEEMESLKLLHRQELDQAQSSAEETRSVQQKQMKELSAALRASEENNAALLKENYELNLRQDAVQEQFLQTVALLKKKKKRRWLHFW